MNFKALTERKNDLITRAESIVNDAELNKRELTDDEKEELAEIRDDVRNIKAKLDALEMIAAETETEKKEEGNEMTDDKRTLDDTEALEVRAFEDYVRGVVNERTDYNMEKSANGAVIPTTIANRIIKKVYDICPILERSTKYNLKGKLEIPYYDESTHAVTVDYATEFEELASSVGSFTKIELDGFLAGALVLISRSLINNAQFNVVDFIVEHMAFSIRRWIEGECLNGTSQKIAGLSGLTNGITTAATSAITADEVVRLHDSIKDIYQNNAIWIMSPATRTALRTLKDGMGRYLLQDDISSPFGTTLLGKPVYVSDNMNDIEAGKVVIYYGDMGGLATKFSEDMSIEVLREKYATQHAVGVVGWLEFDAKVCDNQMIAKLTMKSA
jgi:HK97 family phage major capsid protein